MKWILQKMLLNNRKSFSLANYFIFHGNSLSKHTFGLCLDVESRIGESIYPKKIFGLDRRIYLFGVQVQTTHQHKPQQRVGRCTIFPSSPLDGLPPQLWFS